jgi:hypothetical protein
MIMLFIKLSSGFDRAERADRRMPRRGLQGRLIQFSSGHDCHVSSSRADNGDMETVPNLRKTMPPDEIPWAIQMRGVSMVEPGRLVMSLTGAIIGCGGWVLSRSASDSGMLNFLFEFERHACVDIYTVLISAGLELSQGAHMRFTELCQCTSLVPRDRGREIVSIDLEVQTLCKERPREAEA